MPRAVKMDRPDAAQHDSQRWSPYPPTSARPKQLTSSKSNVAEFRSQRPAYRLLVKASPVDHDEDTATKGEAALIDLTGDASDEGEALPTDELTTLVEALPHNPSESLKNMAVMPKKRNVKLRPNKSFDRTGTYRKHNQEAALCQTRGVVSAPSCLSCIRGSGTFVQCITVPGEFGGACGNCHYMLRDSRCSFNECTFGNPNAWLLAHIANLGSRVANPANLKAQVESLIAKQTDLENHNANLRSANQLLVEHMDMLLSMDNKEMVEQKDDLRLALILLRSSKGS